MSEIRWLPRLMWHDKPSRTLYGGAACSLRTFLICSLYDRVRWGRLGKYVAHSRRIPGWTRGEEAVALVHTSYALPDAAVIVEIGTFLGVSTVLLAGARKLRRSGRVHCVDPFDSSGDEFSAPVYQTIQESMSVTLRQHFERNIRRARLTKWIEVHQGRADEIAAIWTKPIDLLFLDGDHSYKGVRSAYESWVPFLKTGGIIAVHNSRSGVKYHESHDGSVRLVAETIQRPDYVDIRCIGTTTFARRNS